MPLSTTPQMTLGQQMRFAAAPVLETPLTIECLCGLRAGLQRRIVRLAEVAA